MRGMSIKAKLGWILAVALGFIALMAVMAAQPTFGAHPESPVHYYMIAFACQENRLDCLPLPTGEFNTHAKCAEHLADVQNESRYRIPGHPLVLGKCISRDPAVYNLPKPGKLI